MSSEPSGWVRVALGVPVAGFEPRPAAGPTYRPDTIADGWSTGSLTVRLASVRGYQHRHRGQPRQDDVAAVHDPGTGAVIFAVADGVSSAPQSHLGATAACRAAIGRALTELAGGAVVDWAEVVEHAAWQGAEQAAPFSPLPGPDPARAEEEMAATLVAGLITPDGGFELVRVGDSAAWR